MELNIATVQEAAILKRALYARMAVVHGAGMAANHMRDAVARSAADLEVHTLRILIENVIQVERRLMDAEPPVDIDAIVNLQRPG